MEPFLGVPDKQLNNRDSLATHDVREMGFTSVALSGQEPAPFAER